MLVEQGVEQALLAAEVMVERRLGDADGGHELLHADGVVTPTREELEGRVEQAGARVHRVERAIYRLV